MKSEGKIVVVMMFGLQAFQFNSKYLLAIHDHVYSSQFGTFIGNCQKEREVNTQYLSLKKYLYSFKNFFYNILPFLAEKNLFLF